MGVQLSQQRADRLLIAAVTSPVPGDNGWYDIFVATDSSGPKIREDGRADYRNLGKFVFVQEGAVLGRIHKATPGKPGTTVLGNPVPPSPGKDVDLTKILGDGLGVDVHGGIIALRSGHLHQDPSGKYSIKTSLQIDGDVDFSVGDIRDFPGDIVIKGSVTVGFSVSATGNIFIDGRIEGGTVISHQGDIEQCEVLLKELVARYGSFDKRYKQVLLTKKHHLKSIASLVNLQHEIHRQLLEKNPCVSASNELYQGTIIEILGFRYVMKEPRSYVTFLIQHDVITDVSYRSRRKPRVHASRPK